ncbi:MAG: CpsD/CapB family tyrosine-protein kinase [Gammaproteobacteria bacterium]|nr:CpsD/CapB family tyrosine-protein kinase [Gammaproteobacteria bacterium]
MEYIINALQRAKGTIRPRKPPVRPVLNKETSEPSSYTLTRVFKTVPAYLHEKRVINPLTHSSIYDAYRLLRTHVLQRLREKNWTTLGVTSPAINSGKTLTAINLAISMAMEVNQTALLVDLDLRQPSIHDYFGYLPELGLSDYIQSESSLSEILFNPSLERLVVLPGRVPILNSSETLSTPRMVNLFAELKNRYQNRIVIFDLPPLLSADDALVFSSYVDAFLLVVEDNKTQIDDIARAKEMLKHANVIGNVLNKSTITARK